MDIYNNQEYLKKNKTWHEEDSIYKGSFCIDMIDKNQINFSTIADIGCGAGLISEILAKKYPKTMVYGFDFSTDVLPIWEKREKLDNLKFVNSHFDHNEVDLAICLDVFEHVDNYIGFLQELNKKSKFFIFNIPLDMNLMKIIFGLKYARTEVGHLHYFNTYTALETLKYSGYKIIDYKHSAAFLKTFPRNIRQWAILPFRLLSIILGKRLAATLFGGISLIVFCEKK